MYLQKTEIINKTALVTGAGKGIGKACAIALAEAGANVIILSRTKNDLDKVEKIIKKLKRKCTSYVCDVSNYDALKNVFQKITSLDIVVNNAGTNRPEHFTKIKKEDMDYVVDLNIKAAFHVAQLGSLIMLKSKKRKSLGGSIINISSATSKNMGPNPKNGPYGASKSAVNSMTASFSQELAPKIRVNAIAPGPVPTDNFNESVGVHSEEETKALMGMMNLPLKRLGTPEDIGAAVVFMASPASDWITGQCLFVDGGM